MDRVLNSVFSKSKIFESLQAEPSLGRPLGPTCPNDSLRNHIERNHFQTKIKTWGFWLKNRCLIWASLAVLALTSSRSNSSCVLFITTLPTFFSGIIKTFQRLSPWSLSHLRQFQIVDDESWFWPQVDCRNGVLGHLLMVKMVDQH